MSEIHIVAETRLAPGAREEIMPMLQKLVEGSRSEPGNISYDVLTDTENPDHLFFVETWASLDAIEHHNASAHFREFAEAMAGKREENRVTRLVKLL